MREHDAAGAIREAIPNEFGLLRQIEEQADALFLDVGIGPFVVSEEEDHLSQPAVVLAYGTPPVGFACVDVVDGVAHLWQLAVAPTAGRRGRGRALVRAVCEWAATNGYPAVTLTTYQDVPWNAPFYASMGFQILEELTPGLRAIREHEHEIGDDDFGPRVAMRKDIAVPA